MKKISGLVVSPGGRMVTSQLDICITSNHFKFHFLWKTYSLVSDDFCNLSATRVLVKTNGEDVKNIKLLSHD